MTKNYLWTDNPTKEGEAEYSPEILNQCLMHLKYNNSDFSLFDYKIVDHLLTGNNLAGWELSDNSWKSGAVYSDAYNLLLAQYNSGVVKIDTVAIGGVGVNKTINCKQGTSLFKIVDVANVAQVDDLFATTGSAWYYIIDIPNQRFKLPRSSSFDRLTTDVNKVGEYEFDQFQGHYHRLADGNYGYGLFGNTGGGALRYGYGTPETANAIMPDGTNGTPRCGNETRSRSIKKLVYFKVGNSVADDSSINVAGFNYKLKIFY